MTGTQIIVEIPTKIVIETNIETSTEIIALTVIEVGLEKNIMLMVFVSGNPRVEQFHRVLQQLSPDK